MLHDKQHAIEDEEKKGKRKKQPSIFKKFKPEFKYGFKYILIICLSCLNTLTVYLILKITRDMEDGDEVS